MKRIVLIAGILLAVLAMAWAAPALLNDPGYVLIDLGRWRIEMSAVVLAGAVLGGWIVLFVVLALLRLPGRTWRRLRRARADRQLDKGLLALTEGDWERAEKALGRALENRSSTAGYLAAARAAQGRSAPERRDRWLELAAGRFGRRRFVAGLARARLLAAEGRLAEAVPVLERLHLSRPSHAGVLRLLMQAYQESGRWRDLRLLAPALKRTGIVERDKVESLVRLAASRELDACVDPAELTRVHGGLGRKLRREPEVVAAYARRALELGRSDLSEAPLRRAIDGHRSAELLDLYAHADDSDRERRSRQCERWMDEWKGEGDGEAVRGALELALGKLYLAGRDYEKARRHLEKAVRVRPDANAYAALGRVLDRGGELEAAAQCYRNALRLEQGRAAEPLPPPE